MVLKAHVFMIGKGPGRTVTALHTWECAFDLSWAVPWLVEKGGQEHFKPPGVADLKVPEVEEALAQLEKCFGSSK